MYHRDTIAALSTASGAAAVAIVRVSGPDALTIAGRVFRAANGATAEQWVSHRLCRGRFVDAAERTLDHGLAVLMRAPRSYTGEDVLELHGHGGAVVARSLLAAVLAAGARGAERGEFTSRAFLNGKLDLAQAESIADLIAAPTDRAARVAVDQLGGSLTRVVDALRERLIDVAAHLEAAIDFSDEDVGELDRDGLARQCDDVANELRALASTHARGRLLRDGMHVALVGRPNVGKSSLLNRLLGAERAIVTPIPGTTRDVIEEAIDIDGVAVVLADTAGIRAEPGAVEELGIRRTLERIELADTAVVVLDNSQGWSRTDQDVVDAVRQKQCIILVNKIDLPTQLSIPKGLSGYLVRASAVTGEGIDDLKQVLARCANVDDRNDGVIVLRERHRIALEAAATSVAHATASLAGSQTPDLVAVDIMVALDHLGQIVGRTSPEDVLDRVFREFCIGK